MSLDALAEALIPAIDVTLIMLAAHALTHQGNACFTPRNTPSRLTAVWSDALDTCNVLGIVASCWN